MQCIKESSTLRVSRKKGKMSPRIVFRNGKQDKEKTPVDYSAAPLCYAFVQSGSDYYTGNYEWGNYQLSQEYKKVSDIEEAHAQEQHDGERNDK